MVSTDWVADLFGIIVAILILSADTYTHACPHTHTGTFICL